jgi:hypothetical protein
MTATNRGPKLGSINQGLRMELLAMAVEDQRMIKKPGLPETPEQAEENKRMRLRHATRLKEIIVRYGWPGGPLVGGDGAHGAWLLALNSGDDKFTEECLPLMERAVATGEANAGELAYLVDRVRVIHGQPQVYGTQFTPGKDGDLVLYQIEDRAAVDERRKGVGLESLAEYEKRSLESRR